MLAPGVIPALLGALVVFAPLRPAISPVVPVAYTLNFCCNSVSSFSSKSKIAAFVFGSKIFPTVVSATSSVDDVSDMPSVLNGVDDPLASVADRFVYLTKMLLFVGP